MDVASPEEPALGQQFSLDRIWLCLSFLLDGKTSLRAVPRLCRVFDDVHHGSVQNDVPDWTTSRMWLMRLGLGRLRQPLVKADDWVWLLDHSVQMGRDKCFAVLGVRLSELADERMCLRRQDMHLLHLKIMRDPNMNTNHQELLEVWKRTGMPRVLLSDHGADLRGGMRLFREGLGSAGERIIDVHDIKHRTALALKHRMEGLPRWSEFLSLVGKTRKNLQQTEWAFLRPPMLRSKSRYLNLGELLRWGWRTIRLMKNEPLALGEHGDMKKLKEKMGWLEGFEEDMKIWVGWYRVAARTEEVMRKRGLYRGVENNLRVRLSGLMKDASSREMAEELLAFVKEQSQALQEGEKVPASTEVLESCFGTLKSLEKDQSRSGFTGLALGLGALIGNLTKQEAGRLLRSTPAKAVRRWCKENVGQSLQRKRRRVYRLVGVTDLV